MRAVLERGVDTSEWGALLAADSHSTFYHEPVWLECLDRAYPYFHPLCLFERDDAGRVLGGLPAIRSVRAGLTQLFSLPYGTYGHPLTASLDPLERREVRRALIASWGRLAREPRVVRAHLVLFDSAEGDDALPATWRQAEETQRLDLGGGFDQVWKRYDGDKRTDCRKAEREGVTAEDETGMAGVSILETLYRRQAGGWSNHTAFPPRLLHELAERAPDNVRVWVARREKTPLAAQMVFHHKRSASTWLSVSVPDARRLGAGNLLYNAVIEDACRRGHDTFNLGDSRGHALLRNYKAGFGAVSCSYSSCLYEPAWFRPLHRFQYRLRGIR
jgi:CelD/BcsL family acetyltransferase involved in cellulose biosynthesis